MFGNDNDALEELNQEASQQSLEELRQEKNTNAQAAVKKELQIDIDENLDFDQQNEVAQQLLDDNVIEHDKKLLAG